jgi:hypothetical protein
MHSIGHGPLGGVGCGSKGRTHTHVEAVELYPRSGGRLSICRCVEYGCQYCGHGTQSEGNGDVTGPNLRPAAVGKRPTSASAHPTAASAAKRSDESCVGVRRSWRFGCCIFSFVSRNPPSLSVRVGAGKRGEREPRLRKHGRTKTDWRGARSFSSYLKMVTAIMTQ